MQTANGPDLPGCSRGFTFIDDEIGGFKRLFGSRRRHITLSEDVYVGEAACGFLTL
jgi:hypothetical protein